MDRAGRRRRSRGRGRERLARRHYLRSFVERYERWLDAAGDWPLDWRAAAELGDALLRVTPAQLAEFEAELLALIDRYRDPSPDDPDVRAVEMFYHAVPQLEGQA